MYSICKEKKNPLNYGFLSYKNKNIKVVDQKYFAFNGIIIAQSTTILYFCVTRCYENNTTFGDLNEWF